MFSFQLPRAMMKIESATAKLELIIIVKRWNQGISEMPWSNVPTFEV